MVRRLIALAIAALILATASSAQNKSPPTVIHAGKLLDRPGQAPRGPATIVIRDGRIESVADGFQRAERGARVIDLRRQFVLPGLIDAHVHLTSDKAGVEAIVLSVTASLPAAAYEAAFNARKTLDAGFTTVRNVGDRAGVTLALRDAIAAGKAVGPRILDAGTSISTTSGHMDPTLGFRGELHEALDVHENLCDGVESCRRAVRMQIRRGVDLIKIATTGGVNSRIGAGLGRQMFDDEVKALVDTAHLYGRKVAVHAHGADGIAMALRAGADSIEHGTLMTAAEARLFVRSGAYYVPTLSTVNGYLERLKRNPGAYTPEVKKKIEWRISITGKAFRLAHEAGVKIAFGTDAGVSLHGRNADEFELMVRHGMTPAEAIEAATVNAADLLGLSDQIGALAPGKRADLIAVKGDPRSDVTVLKSVPFVMQGGEVRKDRRERPAPVKTSAESPAPSQAAAPAARPSP
jgi:imidazolonepropionase-like amidohydrolase